jgi:type II secretory pathway pseudopilin PulG
VNRRTGQRAFTLVELLLAVMVTVLVAVSTVAMLRGANGTRQRVNRQMALQQETRAALEAITAALRNAVRASGDDALLEGLDAESDGLPTDRVRFRTTSSLAVRRGEPESDVRECEFFLHQIDPNRPPMLMQRLDPTRNEEPDGGGVVQCVAENIVGLDLAYFDGLEWRDEWSAETDGWPTAVRVSLVAVDAEDGRTPWPAQDVVNFPRMPASSESQEQNPNATAPEVRQ